MHALLLALALACPHDPTLDAAARSARIPPAMAQAVARVESNCDPTAVSATGALGLLQVLPSWGRSNLTWRCDPLTRVLGGSPALTWPTVNACFGTRILRYEFARSHGSWRRALGAYSGHSYPHYVPQVRAALRRLLQGTPRHTTGGPIGPPAPTLAISAPRPPL